MINVILIKEDALKIEKQPRKSGGPRTVYIFKCINSKCTNKISVRSGKVLAKSRGLCMVCSHTKKPYESIYYRLDRDWRKVGNDMTYTEFIQLTKIKNCHYCNDKINWVPYATVKGKFLSSAHYLDRKDHNKSYSVSNCVVCCTLCNRMRSNKFTYEEFLIIGLAIKEVKYNRLYGN